MRRSSTGGRGQSALEFALVLPILLALLLGVIDLGRGIYANNVIAMSSRQGSRYLSLYPAATDSQLVQAATAGVAGLDTNMLSVAAVPADPNLRTSGTQVTVTVSYSFYPIVPVSGMVYLLTGSSGSQSGDYFSLRSSASTYVE